MRVETRVEWWQLVLEKLTVTFAGSERSENALEEAELGLFSVKFDVKTIFRK